jgi:DNA-binding response OmpR family regulator
VTPDVLQLTPNERRVLALLLRRRHVSPSQIMIHLYGTRPTCDVPVETPERQAEMLINRVRRKLPGIDIRTTDAGWEVTRATAKALTEERAGV